MPERGKPTTKTGRVSGTPQPRRRAKELGGELGDDPIDELGILVGVIGQAAFELAGGLMQVGDVDVRGGFEHKARAGS